MRSGWRITILALAMLLCGSAQTTPPGKVETGQVSPEAPLKVGGSVTPPRVIYSPDPGYSDKAQKAHYQETCVLWLIVGADGHPRDIRVARAIGMGLDEKAIEAVRTWRFKPARKDGQPVAVQINVEVEFRLYGSGESEIDNLWRKADAGDAKAQLKLARIFLAPPTHAKDDEQGLALLQKAAKQGLPEAQFRIGEYVYGHASGSSDYVAAYMWYALAGRGGYKQSLKMLKVLAPKMSPEQLSEAENRLENWSQSSQ